MISLIHVDLMELVEDKKVIADYSIEIYREFQRCKRWR